MKILDPLKFHSFMALFNESVDKVTDDDQDEIASAFTVYCGNAGTAIEPYSRTILKNKMEETCCRVQEEQRYVS